MWYVHEPRVCQDCDAKFVFTARQQQHWFEVLKIPIYVIANRCAKEAHERDGQTPAASE